MTYDQEVISVILKELKPFDSLNLKDPVVVIGINAIALQSLVNVQNTYTGFDGDINFDYDPVPYLKVSWRHGITGSGEDIIFRFNPLRVDNDENETLLAYDRAMSII